MPGLASTVERSVRGWRFGRDGRHQRKPAAKERYKAEMGTMPREANIHAPGWSWGRWRPDRSGHASQPPILTCCWKSPAGRRLLRGHLDGVSVRGGTSRNCVWYEEVRPKVIMSHHESTDRRAFARCEGDRYAGGCGAVCAVGRWRSGPALRTLRARTLPPRFAAGRERDDARNGAPRVAQADYEVVPPPGRHAYALTLTVANALGRAAGAYAEPAETALRDLRSWVSVRGRRRSRREAMLEGREGAAEAGGSGERYASGSFQ